MTHIHTPYSHVRIADNPCPFFNDTMTHPMMKYSHVTKVTMMNTCLLLAPTPYKPLASIVVPRTFDSALPHAVAQSYFCANSVHPFVPIQNDGILSPNMKSTLSLLMMVVMVQNTTTIMEMMAMIMSAGAGGISADFMAAIKEAMAHGGDVLI